MVFKTKNTMDGGGKGRTIWEVGGKNALTKKQIIK
jgi:hypothetical protein